MEGSIWSVGIKRWLLAAVSQQRPTLKHTSPYHLVLLSRASSDGLAGRRHSCILGPVSASSFILPAPGNTYSSLSVLRAGEAISWPIRENSGSTAWVWGMGESLLITSDTLTNSLSNYTLIRLLISSVSVAWMIVFSCLSHESKAISLGADIKMHPLSLPSPPLRVNRTQYTLSFTATWLSRSKEPPLYPAHTSSLSPCSPGSCIYITLLCGTASLSESGG